MDSEERQLVPLLFKKNHFQHTRKEEIWNEVCFPITNILEDLMLHVYHDPLVRVFQSSIKEEDDVCIKMFVLPWQGKVKKWFENLLADSMSNFQQFMQVFLG